MNVTMLKTSRARSGFTMIELLVVMMIIVLVSGLLIGTYAGVRTLFRGVSVQQRMGQISHALEVYKQKHGEYPPDGSRLDEIRRHILKRWPNVLRDKSTYGGSTKLQVYLTMVPRDPHKALLFWLCGPPRGTGGAVGFSTDPNDPFGLTQNGTNFVFDPNCDTLETPLIDLSFDGNAADGRDHGNCNFAEGCFVYADKPVVYFRAEKFGYLCDKYAADGTLIQANVPKLCYYDDDPSNTSCSVIHMAAPYMKGNKWVNPDSYQLIYPGDDGQFGSKYLNNVLEDAGRQYVARNLSDQMTFKVEDEDNITNFCTGGTLKDDM
ncbi:MAG: type II secretion system protein [Thermoguttaceae bacterium]|nr:type II secretion system protein [Thermoguttaceae bacterium]